MESEYVFQAFSQVLAAPPVDVIGRFPSMELIGGKFSYVILERENYFQFNVVWCDTISGVSSCCV